MSAAPSGSPAAAEAVAHVIVEAPTEHLVVAGDPGHHLTRVRRLRPGERITAGDGRGRWRAYRVVAADSEGLECAADGPEHLESPPPVGVALAVALTKGGIEDVVTAVTELGVVRVIPVVSERVVVRWDDDRARRATLRLGSAARAAAEQARRAHLPTIDPVTPLGELAGRPGLVLADRTGGPADALTPPAEGEWTVVVGPEGGFAPAEVEAFGDCPRLAVGPHVLRAVTAPIAAVAVLTARLAAWSA